MAHDRDATYRPNVFHVAIPQEEAEIDFMGELPKRSQ